jgi:hypothetical protein
MKVANLLDKVVDMGEAEAEASPGKKRKSLDWAPASMEECSVAEEDEEEGEDLAEDGSEASGYASAVSLTPAESALLAAGSAGYLTPVESLLLAGSVGCLPPVESLRDSQERAEEVTSHALPSSTGKHRYGGGWAGGALGLGRDGEGSGSGKAWDRNRSESMDTAGLGSSSAFKVHYPHQVSAATH